MTTAINLPKEVLEQFERLHVQSHKDTEVKRLAIVASKGSLDMAYPALILATTGAAMGWEASVFFTFYGLDVVNKKKYRKLQVAPLANPAAPVPIPNILGAIPGMTWMATRMMKFMFKRSNVPSIEQMLGLCNQLGVKLIGCSTTMGVMGVKQEDLLDGVSVEGAAAFLHFASKAQVTLFV